MSDEPFPGWDRPHYTQVPDNFFDFVMADLTLAETRVMLYIIRRTLGFQRDAAAISIDQIRHGLVAADGTVLERGTELGRTAVTDALRSLIARGMIVAQRNESPEFGTRPTTYSMPFLPQGESAPADGGRRTRGQGESAPATSLPLERNRPQKNR